MDTFREIFSRLPTSASQELVLLPPAVIGQIEEIRLRCGQLPRILYGKSEKTLTRITTREDLQKTLHNLIKFSYYAYEDDLAKGFVTIAGGHRVGICGKAVVKNDQPSLIKEISSMNIRFARDQRLRQQPHSHDIAKGNACEYSDRLAAGLRQDHLAQRYCPCIERQGSQGGNMR